MSNFENNYKNFYYSFLIIIISNLIYFYTTFINKDINRIIEILLGLHIFFSIFFLVHKFHFKNFFIKNNIYLLLLIYCLIQYIRPPADNYDNIVQNYWLSKFGGVTFDSIFLLPIFYLWSFYKDSIKWFEKLSLLSVKIGIISIPICYILNISYIYFAFYPIYYLIIGYEYSSLKRKIWINAGLIISTYIFFIEDYRSGIARTFLILILLFILKFKFRKFNKFLLYILILSPILLLIIFFNNDNISFQTFLNYFEFIDPKFTLDTRTFIYIDVINHFKNTGNLFFGDGGFGNYYSYYMDVWTNLLGKTSGDNIYRSGSEVGILNILLKGGIFLMALIIILILKMANITTKLFNNNYTYKLGFVVALYFMFMSIENVYIFNFFSVSFWILLSISSNQNLNKLNDNEIAKIFKNI